MAALLDLSDVRFRDDVEHRSGRGRDAADGPADNQEDDGAGRGEALTINFQPLLITVDTNVLLSRLKEREAGHENAKALLALDGNGLCEIRVTTRVDPDVPEEPLRSQIESLPVVTSPVGSIFRIGVSKLDSGDMIAGPEMVKLTDDLMALLFPHSKRGHKKHSSNLRDVDHLAAHKFANRDVFVTDDRPILSQQNELVDRFGIRVMGLSEIVTELKTMADNRAD